MERPKGKEALSYLPFRDVVIPEEKAVEILTAITRKVVKSNLENKILSLESQDLGEDEFINTLRELSSEDASSQLPAGGLSTSVEDLHFLYSSYGNQAFEQVTTMFFEHVFPERISEKPVDRNPASICIGYILDLLEIIDPEVATFEEGVEIMLESARKTNFSFFVLGAQVDDTYHLRGTHQLPLELMLDKEKVLSKEKSELK